MSGSRRVITILGLVALTVTSCGGGKSASNSSTSTTSTRSPSTTATSIASTTTTTEPLTVNVTVSPDHIFAGTLVHFTVDIRGPGTLDSENVQFGDGGTSGANAGIIKCGASARADHTSSYEHSYANPGTYGFSDDVEVIGPPPVCASVAVTGTATVLVAASMPNAVGGAVQSPTGNIACGIYYGSGTEDKIHCATFSPPQTADMTVSGTVTRCSGSQCSLGNPGFNVPTLPYGAATGVGPFECVSATSGMTCTITGGKGFTISRSGIQLVGG